MAAAPLRLAYLSEIAVFAAIYFVAARLGLAFALPGHVSEVWPATGVAIAILTLRSRALWPAIFIGAVAGSLSAVPWYASIGIAAGDTLEALLAASLLSLAEFRPSMKRLRDVGALFVLAALISPTVNATIGVATLCFAHIQPWSAFRAQWWPFWSGDAVATLVVAPVIFTWTSQLREGWQVRRLGEAAVLTGLLLILSVLVFKTVGPGDGTPLHYLIFPMIIWAALRLGQHATASIALGAATVSLMATLAGRGPFLQATLDASFLQLEVFMAVLSVTGLFLGAAMAERNRAERRRNADFALLRQSEERLALALSAGQMGAWEWDIEKGTVEWSRMVEHLHAMKPGSFAGTFQAFRELIHPEDEPRVMEALQKAVRENGHYETEFRHLRGDGSIHWVAARARVIEERGRAVRMVGVVMDISERKRITDALRLQAEQLAEADRRKDEFLAVLGHELRNPLAPIQNALELLAVRPDDASNVERARALMARQVRHLVRLVDDLLDVSRIRSGKIALVKSRVELGALVRSAVELSKPVIDARGHALKVDMPPNHVWFDADSTRVPQLLANLLNNAAKYTADGGQIWLSARADDSEILIKVRDTGIGMTPQALAEVFELFAQGDGAQHAVQGGLGVGLSLARSLAELHGGSLKAHSDGPGTGTEFELRLPYTNRGEAPAAPTTTASVQTKIRRVLIVDDNADAADSLGLILRHSGHDVRVAHAGREALDIAHEFMPEVWILDLGMPDMDGYDVARAVRSDAALSDTRLIALSGYGQTDDRARTRDAGFHAHLVKPVEYEALERVISAA